MNTPAPKAATTLWLSWSYPTVMGYDQVATVTVSCISEPWDGPPEGYHPIRCFLVGTRLKVRAVQPLLFPDSTGAHTPAEFEIYSPECLPSEVDNEDPMTLSLVLLDFQNRQVLEGSATIPFPPVETP